MTDRFYGALFGLAYGEAISFPALFHRFQAAAIPRKRHNTLWQTEGSFTLRLRDVGLHRYSRRLAAAFDRRWRPVKKESAPRG